MKPFPLSVLLTLLASTPAAASELVIGHVETANWRMTLLTSEQGPRFTVRDKKSGELLAKAVDETRLAEAVPEAHRVLIRGRAATHIEWAGL